MVCHGYKFCAARLSLKNYEQFNKHKLWQDDERLFDDMRDNYVSENEKTFSALYGTLAKGCVIEVMLASTRDKSQDLSLVDAFGVLCQAQFFAATGSPLAQVFLG